jgi:predicted Zn-dependent protease
MRTSNTRARPWLIMAALLTIASIVAGGAAGGVLAVAALACGFTAASRYLRTTQTDERVQRAGMGGFLGG